MALVLAVDDRMELLDGIGDVLETQHSCLLASNGEEALRAYANNRPALVILDLLMPGMSGREVAQRILEMDPCARIMIFSVVENIGEIVALFRQGVCDYLAKPGNPEALIRAVNANLSLLPEPPLAPLCYAAGMRDGVLQALKSGLIPVIAGPRGIGKRTCMKEAFKRAGAASPVTIGPMPGRRPDEWFGSGMRFPSRETGGIVAWASGMTLGDLDPEELTKWWAATRIGALGKEERLAGITVDIPAGVDAGALLPAVDSGFFVIGASPLSDSPEDIAAYIAHLEAGKRTAGESRVGLIREVLAAHPSLGTLNFLRVMFELPEFLRHLVGAMP